MNHCPSSLADIVCQGAIFDLRRDTSGARLGHCLLGFQLRMWKNLTLQYTMQDCKCASRTAVAEHGLTVL